MNELDELINKSKKGDKESYTKLIMKFEDDLYKIARVRLDNEFDIEDVIQETMIESFKNIKKLRDNRKFKSWIIIILINKCNKLYKSKYKKNISYEEYNFDNYISNNSTNKIEDDIDFYYLINNLNYDEKMVVILYYMERYTVKEIEEILNMKQGTIKTHLYKARNKIKIKLEKYIEDRGGLQ